MEESDSVETSVEEESEVVISVDDSESAVDVEVVSSVPVELSVPVVEESVVEEPSVVGVVLLKVEVDVSVPETVYDPEGVELPSPLSPPERGEVGSDSGLVSVEPVRQVLAKVVETDMTVCVIETVLSSTSYSRFFMRYATRMPKLR